MDKEDVAYTHMSTHGHTHTRAHTQIVLSHRRMKFCHMDGWIDIFLYTWITYIYSLERGKREWE